MSLRWYIYYCALCGGCAAYLGWALGHPINADTVTRTTLQGMFLGLMIALGLGLLDSLWNGPRGDIGQLAIRVLIGVAVGCLGGALGGFVGQKLGYGLLMIGWLLTGLLVGSSIGVYDLIACAMRNDDMRGAVKKTVNGVIGGGAGGLLGGILFLLIATIWKALLSDAALTSWTPPAWGFVALGLCIGLLMGMAQVILKEAWVKVEAGFRSGRELLLTRPQITIGRGEGCDIGLFGDSQVDKQHCRIVRKGKNYVLIDDDSSTGTYVNDERVEGTCRLRSGDVIQLGKARLRFGERAKRG